MSNLDKKCKDFKTCEECPLNNFTHIACVVAGDSNKTIREITDKSIEELNKILKENK